MDGRVSVCLHQSFWLRAPHSLSVCVFLDDQVPVCLHKSFWLRGPPFFVSLCALDGPVQVCLYKSLGWRGLLLFQFVCVCVFWTVDMFSWRRGPRFLICSPDRAKPAFQMNYKTYVYVRSSFGRFPNALNKCFPLTTNI